MKWLNDPIKMYRTSVKLYSHWCTFIGFRIKYNWTVTKRKKKVWDMTLHSFEHLIWWFSCATGDNITSWDSHDWSITWCWKVHFFKSLSLASSYGTVLWLGQKVKGAFITTWWLKKKIRIQFDNHTKMCHIITDSTLFFFPFRKC